MTHIYKILGKTSQHFPLIHKLLHKHIYKPGWLHQVKICILQSKNMYFENNIHLLKSLIALLLTYFMKYSGRSFSSAIFSLLTVEEEVVGICWWCLVFLCLVKPCWLLHTFSHNSHGNPESGVVSFNCPIILLTSTITFSSSQAISSIKDKIASISSQKGNLQIWQPYYLQSVHSRLGRPQLSNIKTENNRLGPCHQTTFFLWLWLYYTLVIVGVYYFHSIIWLLINNFKLIVVLCGGMFIIHNIVFLHTCVA